MKVTIRDIAREAGVSPATVSNVFNGKNKISEKTRELVLAIAQRRGYAVPAGMSPENRTLRFIIFKRHGKVIMDTPFFSELISSIESACRAHQYELLISYMDAGDPNLRTQIADVLKNGSRGILLLATEMNDENLQLFKNCKMPLLVLDSLFLWDDHNAVIINNREAGYLAAEHLVEHGHRSFGLITSSFPFNNMTDRRDGYAAGLAKHGFTLREEDVFYVEPTMEGAARDMLALLERRAQPLPTAMFASNDIIAVGASRALKQRGFALPDDVSIIGMDDLPICCVTSPQLSTLAVHKRQLGTAAVNRLIEMIECRDSAVYKIALDVQLVQRESVKELRAAEQAAILRG